MRESRKQRLVYLLIALTTVPFFFAVKHPYNWSLEAENYKALAQYVTSVLGYIGISLLVWEFILGTRAITGIYFDDLAAKLKIHKWLGIYGTILVFLHPFVAAYYYGKNIVTYPFLPDVSTHFNVYVTFGRLAFLMLIAVWVTSALVRKKVKYRPWKYIHYLSYPVLALALIHAPVTGSSYGNQYIQFFYKSFLAITIICVVLRVRHLFGYGKVTYTITKKNQLTPDIWLMRLRSDKKNLTINPAQYVYLQPGLTTGEHPFTIISHDNKTGEIALAFKVFGKLTQKLESMSVGDKVLVDGPYGVFTKELVEKPKMPVVFIAGGIGITPFVEYCLHSEGMDRWLFFANQNKTSGAFKAVLKKALGKNFVEVLSNEEGEASRGDERGFMSKQILVRYIDKPEKYDYFICGPTPMMNAVKKMLSEIGISEERIHIEEFSF